MNIECFCNENRKKCPAESKPVCKEYIIKLIEIKRTEQDIEFEKEEKVFKDAVLKLKKQEAELRKTIRKFKI
jgi:hypothetical protein